MTYDEALDILKIDVREFVRDARRGICTSLPHDENEPLYYEKSTRVILNALSECEIIPLEFSFMLSGTCATISGKVYKDESGELIFITPTEKSTPRKEEKAQARGEAFALSFLYINAFNLSGVDYKLIYIDPKTGEKTEECEHVDKAKLTRFFERCRSVVEKYARPEIERVKIRLPSMKSLAFPYKEIRAGQSEFIKKTYKIIARGGTLFATAPTGTGKTVSALFPAVRAMGDKRRDKTFYLTPKDTTAISAKECLELFRENGAIIRAILISAKEKQCTQGTLCRESYDLCKRSQKNSLTDAVLALYDMGVTVVTRGELLAVADKYNVCPYELSLAYAELCDVVICDVNYLFDPDVFIRRFFTSHGNYTFLVDEAHNLPDRAREMYSAELSLKDLKAPELSELLGAYSDTKNATRGVACEFYNIIYPLVKEEMREDEKGMPVGATHLKEIPTELYSLFDSLCQTVSEEICQNLTAKDAEKSQRLKFLRSYLYRISAFRRVMESFDDCYEMFVFAEGEDIRVKFYCIDPSKEITKRLSRGEATVFFSATLTPLYYYKSVLGNDRSAETLSLPSPFDTSQLSVCVMDKISTRFSEREDTLLAVSRAIAGTVSAKRGNYMIFSPSFAYSEALARVFMAKYPKLKVLVQRRDMTREEKDELLFEFSKKSDSYLIAFCVLGGIYSEGIDLAGDSLIGAVVVGIGMPSLSYEREAISAYYDEKFEEGKQFAYIYPGMNRVLQASGRVIRREDDRGVIVLIDDRFDDPIYKKIIPSLWKGMKFIGDARLLREELDRFWQEDTGDS